MDIIQKIIPIIKIIHFNTLIKYYYINDIYMNQLNIFIAKNLFILIACLYIILNVQINYPIKLLITIISACTIVMSFQKYIKESYKIVNNYNDIDESDYDKLLIDGSLDKNIMQYNLDKYKENIKKIENDYDKSEIDSEDEFEYEPDSDDEIDLDNKIVKQLLDNIEDKLDRDKEIAEELVKYKGIYNSNKLTRKHNKLYASKKILRKKNKNN